MPTYDYACPDCGDFDALRSLAQRNELCACPRCGSASPRVMTQAPRLACT
ncbi:MAG: FmdB family zinc ribbon protein, partial [Ottowia sp.]